jgi:isocitrate dehydrogenase
VNELDNRGSQFYLTMYWAEALAGQSTDADMAATFEPLAKRLAADEATIARELIDCQGDPVDLGGYYFPDPDRVAEVMRPSPTFNDALASLTP